MGSGTPRAKAAPGSSCGDGKYGTHLFQGSNWRLDSIFFRSSVVPRTIWGGMSFHMGQIIGLEIRRFSLFKEAHPHSVL
jgi:hypothetical protein